jgi:hypothetical protein
VLNILMKLLLINSIHQKTTEVLEFMIATVSCLWTKVIVSSHCYNGLCNLLDIADKMSGALPSYHPRALVQNLYSGAGCFEFISNIFFS